MAAERLHHPAVVRVCHWAFAIALVVLISSGLEIFAAFPSFGDKIPESTLFVPPAALRLGGWLGGALQWHLTFAVAFSAILAVYLAYQIVSGNGRQVLFTHHDVAGVGPMARHYLMLGPRPALAGIYNPLQKLAYTAVVACLAASVVTGAALYKPVQLSWLVSALGGFRSARILHFISMGAVLAFIPGHIVMVALHGWSNFASMLTGSKRGD